MLLTPPAHTALPRSLAVGGRQCRNEAISPALSDADVRNHDGVQVRRNASLPFFVFPPAKARAFLPSASGR